MADFTIDTDAMRRAAIDLADASRRVQPRASELEVRANVLASDAVADTLTLANVNLTARARANATDLETLADALNRGAELLQERDEELGEWLDSQDGWVAELFL